MTSRLLILTFFVRSDLKNVSFSEKMIAHGIPFISVYHYQCPTPRGHGEIQLFQKFQKIADGGPRRKTEKFWQIEKKNK